MISSRAIAVAVITAVAATAAIAIPPATQPGMNAGAERIARSGPSRGGDFIKQAADGYGEVTLGRLAGARDINPQVR